MARRTFFSFYYKEDIWRAMNVRNSWVVQAKDQIDSGFFDASVFEATQKESDDSLKNFLRDGLKNTSVTCVLSGTNTYARRWVRYEIVRSVLKGNGLLTIDIHGVKNSNEQISVKGNDPLDYIGLYKSNGSVNFVEWTTNNKWEWYQDYTLAISEGDIWFAIPSGSITTIGSKYPRYDFAAQNGRTNIAGWIETAAALAGV